MNHKFVLYCFSSQGIINIIELNEYFQYESSNIFIINNKALSSINLFISWIAHITLKVSDFYLVCIFIAKEEFTEAGSYLKGYVTTGIYSEEDVLRL